ncbi:hypothetical protein [Absidia glauca]|uniref:Uncharacterized protein n=1 Tax=Absidia glauca TaxID=4829 RepID=A0A168KTQ7_ABSGL|nr:hypothetical protein [Absidia glauca]
MFDHRRPSFIQFSKHSKQSLDQGIGHTRPSFIQFVNSPKPPTKEWVPPASDGEEPSKRSLPDSISEEDSDDKDTLPPNDEDDGIFYDALEMQEDFVD